jgi:uncharacterized protein DUF1592/uncharacterized protein DUF1588/uncharacterized protein DUF1587/uncharacterized protein DUF1585/uncharacterized protein DUF1595
MATSTWQRWVWLPAVILPFGAASCVGNLGEGPGDDVVDPAKTPVVCDGVTIHPGEAPARRMTRFEYDNTVRDLLGDATSPGSDFPADEVSGIFNNQADTLVVSQLLAEGYMKASEVVAGNAVKNLDTLVGCDPKASSEAKCGAQFIESFGKRAFRRPLDTDGRALLTDVFTKALGMWDYPTAIRLVIQTALQSSRFIYRLEFGMPAPTAPGVVKLDDYEMASRLSYLLWGSTPDKALMDAADAGELNTSEQVSAQATRMLGDAKARGVIENFHAQWLGLAKLTTLDKDTTAFPIYNPALKTTWQQETLAFVDDVVLDGAGDLGTLLSAPYTMMNADTAAFYGISNGPKGSAFEHVDLDPKQRAGLLTQPSVLALNAHVDQTSPVHRGKFVRERLLCELISPPPPNVKAVPPPVDPNATTRERFSQHSNDKSCSICHKLMDPIGFGFESYDAIGQFRTEEAGMKIDDSGEVVNSKDADGKFTGAVELADRLATSEEVRACVVTQWFNYGHGRTTTKEDSCTIQQLKTTFAGAKYDVKALLIGLTQTDAFLYRKPVAVGQ